MTLRTRDLRRLGITPAKIQGSANYAGMREQGGKPHGTGLSDNQLMLASNIRTVSETNAHEFWRRRQGRAKQQRQHIAILMSGPHAQEWLFGCGQNHRFVVTMTRIGKRKLDSDNLASSFKHLRDGVADVLGINDGSDRFDWRYQQRIEKRYGVEILIERVLWEMK